MKNTILRYLVPNHGPDPDAIRTAIALYQKCVSVNLVDAALLTPTKQQLDGSVISDVFGEKPVRALRKGTSVSIEGVGQLSHYSNRTFRGVRSNEVVIAIYPTKKTFSLLDDITNATAIIVVPWIEEDAERWVCTWVPIIFGQEPSPRAKLIENPIIIAGLKALTARINLLTGLSHSLDKNAAVQLFKIFRKNREVFDPNAIRSWALRHGWDSDGADDLHGVAKGVLEGKKFKRDQPAWSADIIDVLRRDTIKENV